MKEKSNIWRSFIPLLILFVSFVGITVFSMIYMAKDNNYDNVIYQYFNISKQMYGKLVYLNISKNMLAEGMNLCSLAFLLGNFLLFWFICSKKDQSKWKWLLITLIGYLLVQALVYSVAFQKGVYFGSLGFLPDARAFRRLYRVFHNVTIVGNFCVLTISCTLMLAVALRKEHIPEVRRIKGTILITQISLAGLYFYIYFSLPDAFLWMSRSTGYISYNSLQMPPYVQGMRIITYLIVIFLLILFYNVFRYQKMQSRVSKEEYAFSSIIASSEISIRAFSHYVKNEILGIMADAEMIASEPGSHESELESIQAACRNMYNRLNDLQRNTNRIVLNQSRQNLSDVITQAVEENRAALEKEGCRIVWNRGKEDAAVFLDSAYMKEVFRNIFQNAAEAMARSEEEKKIEIRMEFCGDNVAVIIEDTGPGFAETVRSSVFDPFVSTKSTKQNWGIGLYFCKRIINSQRGKITADYGGKGGAVIRIELPLAGEDYGKRNRAEKNKGDDCR